MFSITAWQNTVAQATLLPTPIVPDDQMAGAGNDQFVTNLNKLMGAYGCCGAGATRCNIQSPSLRRFNPYEVAPIVLGIVPTAESSFALDYSNAIPLEINEGLEAWHLGAAATVHTILAWLCDNPQPPVSGKIAHIQFTAAAITTVVGQWVGGAITFNTVLPVGKYTVVGCRVLAATAVAYRWNPVGAFNRPGGLCEQAITDRHIIPFRDGYLGKWFDFDTTQLPQLQLLTSAAGAITAVGCLDIIMP